MGSIGDNQRNLFDKSLAFMMRGALSLFRTLFYCSQLVFCWLITSTCQAVLAVDLQLWQRWPANDSAGSSQMIFISNGN